MKLLRRITTASTLIATLLATTGAPATGHVAEGALTCGTVVTTDVRLSASIVDCTGSALVVGAPGITIDLGGHVLDGTGTGPGIDNNAGHDDVTIRGGVIQGFSQGIDMVEADGARVLDVLLRDNALGITASRTARALFARVVARDNSFAGVEVFRMERLVMRRSTVTGSGHGGIIDRSTYDSRYADNVMSDNEFYGLHLDSSTNAVVVGNTAHSNHLDGIQLGFRVDTARLDRNRAIANGAHGVAIEEPGNWLRSNVAIGNEGVGISAPAGTIDAGRNRAFANAGGDCTSIECG